MEKKRCTRCKKEKPVSEFYADRTRKGAFASYCKDCKREHWKEWSHTESGKKSVKQYKESEQGRLVHRKANRKYAKTEKGRKAIRHIQLSPETKERKRKYHRSRRGREVALRGQARWREKYPEKYRAHKAVHRAIESGKLQPPANFVCSICNDERASEYHHPDYSKQLEVVPVCRGCHLELH